MEKCISPLYHVIGTIAVHSEKLFKTVKNLRHVVTNFMDDDYLAVSTGVQDVKDMCFCDASVDSII